MRSFSPHVTGPKLNLSSARPIRSTSERPSGNSYSISPMQSIPPSSRITVWITSVQITASIPPITVYSAMKKPQTTITVVRLPPVIPATGKATR